MKIEDHLKKAIIKMPAAEKDKLLLRLIAKDAILVKKLSFELLEGGETTDERMRDIDKSIEKIIRAGTGQGQTPGYLLMDFRGCNPLITEHAKVTKDKFGEVWLTLRMIRLGLEINSETLKNFKPARFDTLAPYVVRRMRQMKDKIAKLHEDYHFELRKDYEAIMDQIFNGYPAIALQARHEGLEYKWPF